MDTREKIKSLEDAVLAAQRRLSKERLGLIFEYLNEENLDNALDVLRQDEYLISIIKGLSEKI